MNTELTEEAASEIAKLNNNVVGYADHVCEQCAEYKDAAVFFIGIDLEQSSHNNPYRTGQITGLKKEAFLVEAFKDKLQYLKDGTTFCFIEEEAGKSLKLW